MKVGDPVRKIGGDYDFNGHVVAVFSKRARAPQDEGQPPKIRYVVQDDRGALHIFNVNQLQKI